MYENVNSLLVTIIHVGPTVLLNLQNYVPDENRGDKGSGLCCLRFYKLLMVMFYQASVILNQSTSTEY